MGTLRMNNFRILQVEPGKQNAGTFYVKADVYDPKNPTADYAPVTRFGKNFVNSIRRFFPSTGTYLGEDGQQHNWNGLNTAIAAATTRDEIEAKIPAVLKRILNARYVDVPLGGEYCRKFGEARKDRNGVEHAADDFLTESDGTLKVYNTQKVLTSMEYEYVPATDQFGNLIPNPQYPDNSDDEFVMTVAKDENGVVKMHEAAGWESKPAADSIKQAFMVSVEKAIQEVTKKGQTDMIPYQYRQANPIRTAEASEQTGEAAGAATGGSFQ